MACLLVRHIESKKMNHIVSSAPNFFFQRTICFAILAPLWVTTHPRRRCEFGDAFFDHAGLRPSKRLFRRRVVVEKNEEYHPCGGRVPFGGRADAAGMRQAARFVRLRAIAAAVSGRTNEHPSNFEKGCRAVHHGEAQGALLRRGHCHGVPDEDAVSERCVQCVHDSRLARAPRLARVPNAADARKRREVLDLHRGPMVPPGV